VCRYSLRPPVADRGPRTGARRMLGHRAGPVTRRRVRRRLGSAIVSDQHRPGLAGLPAHRLVEHVDVRSGVKHPATQRPDDFQRRRRPAGSAQLWLVGLSGAGGRAGSGGRVRLTAGRRVVGGTSEVRDAAGRGIVRSGGRAGGAYGPARERTPFEAGRRARPIPSRCRRRRTAPRRGPSRASGGIHRGETPSGLLAPERGIPSPPAPPCCNLGSTLWAATPLQPWCGALRSGGMAV